MVGIETRYRPAASPSQRYRPEESTVAVVVPVLVQVAGTVVASSRSKLSVTITSGGRGSSLSSKMPFRILVSSQTVPVMKFPTTTAGRTALAVARALAFGVLVTRTVGVGLAAVAGSAA